MIKNDPKFIDAIFAAKTAREQMQNATGTDTSDAIQPTAVEGVTLAEVTVEEEIPTEKYDDVERIINEAEEAAFLESEQGDDGSASETLKN